MFYFVYYNGAYIARYRTLKACQAFIIRKGLKNDENNLLQVLDSEWLEYPLTATTPND